MRYEPQNPNAIILYCPICGAMFEVDKFEPDNPLYTKHGLKDDYCFTEDCGGHLHIATEEDLEHGALG